jgi:hypothetical protein
MTELDDKEENNMPKIICSEDAMTDEEYEGMKPTTPRTKMNSNDASSTLREVGTTQYVQHK